MLCMGYNLHLGCLDCRERAFVFRNHEIDSIYIWAKRHAGHRSEAAVDNGVAEVWWMEGGSPSEGWTEIGLPDDAS